MKIKIVYFISIVLLFQSCKVYDHYSFSLPESTNIGSVKVINHSGIESIYNNIYLKDSIYYGFFKGSKMASDRTHQFVEYTTELYSDSISAIFARQNRFNKTTIELIEGEEQIRGILYSVSDSSLTIMPTNKDWDIKEGSFKKTIEIKSIQRIKLQKKNKSTKLALASAGVIVGVGLGSIAIAGTGGGDFGENSIIIMAPVVIFGTIGLIISGSSNKTYRIKGNEKIFLTKYYKKIQKRTLVHQEFD